ncbi:MAG: hypothetical protein LBO78_01260 [Rickettsiales bacterium]|jgi:hypothetical protein|nr:hypothetical protein [Rickettsiales bacterium]
MKQIVNTRPMPVWEETTTVRPDGFRQNIGNPVPIRPGGFLPNEVAYSDGTIGCDTWTGCVPAHCRKYGECGYWYNAGQYELSGIETKAPGDVMKNRKAVANAKAAADMLLESL